MARKANCPGIEPVNYIYECMNNNIIYFFPFFSLRFSSFIHSTITQISIDDVRSIHEHWACLKLHYLSDRVTMWKCVVALKESEKKKRFSEKRSAVGVESSRWYDTKNELIATEMRQKFKIQKPTANTNTHSITHSDIMCAVIVLIAQHRLCIRALQLHTHEKSVLILPTSIFVCSMTGAYARKIPLIFHHDKMHKRCKSAQTNLISFLYFGDKYIFHKI